ncbi:MAG: helix-turn-helix transcriptional regulator [Candidatus Sulfotelmatobacter sp.]
MDDLNGFQVLEGLRREPKSSSPKEVLSERELQVLKLVAEGFSSREIAEQIVVGIKTVETYRGWLAEKLGLKSRADIVRYALEVGLLSSEKFSMPEEQKKRPVMAGKAGNKV